MAATRWWRAWAAAAMLWCLGAGAAWAADPASVMPADLDYYVAVDLDAAQQAADEILPQLSQDYWAKSQEPGAIGLAALAAAAPVIHAHLTTVRSLAGPRMAVGVFEFADLYGAYADALLEMIAEAEAEAEAQAAEGEADAAESEAEAAEADAPEKSPQDLRPLDIAQKMLPHLDVVIAVEIGDSDEVKPLLEAMQAAQSAKVAGVLPPLAVHVTDTWVVIATKPERLEQVKAVMEGEQPALAGHAAYIEISEALPEGPMALVYTNPAHFGPQMMEHAQALTEQATVEVGVGEKPEETEEDEAPEGEQEAGPGAMIEAMIDQYMAYYCRMLGDYYAAMRGAGVGYYLARDTVEQREVVLLDAAKMAEVPLLGRVAEPVPMTGAALGALPADSVAAFAAGGVGEQMGALLEGVAELEPSAAMLLAMGKGMLGGFLGLDVDKDLLPAMERDVAVGVLGLDLEGMLPVHVALALQGRDEAAASALAAKLDALATERLETEIERGAIGSAEYRAFALPNAPLSICYAQAGDLLLVATSKEGLAACLAAHAGTTPSLAQAAEVQTLLEGAGDAALVGLVRGGRIWSQVEPIVPSEVKAVLGDGPGLDWLGLALGGDAERQMTVCQMRGDVVKFAETIAQAVGFAVREGMLNPPMPPQPPEPEPEAEPMPAQ